DAGPGRRRHRDHRVVAVQAGGDRDRLVGELDAGQLERAQVEVRIERVGDRDEAGGSRGRGLVLEADFVGKVRAGLDVGGVAEAAGGELVVGVERTSRARGAATAGVTRG